jgi:hypothetical protein
MTTYFFIAGDLHGRLRAPVKVGRSLAENKACSLLPTTSVVEGRPKRRRKIRLASRLGGASFDVDAYD